MTNYLNRSEVFLLALDLGANVNAAQTVMNTLTGTDATRENVEDEVSAAILKACGF